jgi:MFS family permease
VIARTDPGPTEVTAGFVGGERARPEWLRQHPRAWVAAVGTVCFGAFMGQLDASVVTLTYRPIGHSFGSDLATVQWVSQSYLIALALLLVPLGALSDRLGRKRVYLWGFGLFGVASLGCAFAPTLPALIALRAVQGAGAAMLQANSVALVATSVPARRLRTAFGVQAAAQAFGLGIGPTVGGLVVQTIGWRWVFGINVPIALVAIASGRLLLPRTRVSAEGRTSGALRAVGRARGVPVGLVGALFAYLMLFGPIVLVPALLQEHGVSPLRAGLVVAALPAGFAVAAATAERVLPRAWPTGRRCAAGIALTAVGLVGLWLAGTRAGACAAALAGIGLGLGVFTPANNAAIMSTVPTRVAALTGGLVNTARALGTAAGTAVVAAAFTATGNSRLAVAALLVAALATAATVRRQPRHHRVTT